VTRVNFAAALCAAQRIALLILGAVFILNLAACGSSSTTTNAELNQPLTAQPATKPVAIASIIGAPPEVSAKLTEKLSAAAKGKNVNMVPAANAEFTLDGYLVASNDRAGTKLSYIWYVSDKTGKRLKSIKGDEIVAKKKPNDPWSVIEDATIDKIADRTSGELYAWLVPSAAPATPQMGGVPVASAGRTGEPATTGSTAVLTPATTAASAERKPEPARTAAVKPAAGPQGTPIVVVTPVAGAPGDGQTALANAMKKHLASHGIKVAEAGANGAYSVRGVVELGPATDGQQPITIRWLVIDPSGKQLKDAVVQREKIEPGSLDVTWGQVADIAAGAAAVELAKIVPKASS